MQPIPIATPFGASEYQFSALAWFGERLVLVPEKTVRCAGEGPSSKRAVPPYAQPGTLLTLDKAELIAFVDSRARGAQQVERRPVLRPRTDVLRLNASPLCSALSGYEVQGVEAIAFSKDHAVAWMLIETKHLAGDGEMVAWLARGVVGAAQVLFPPQYLRRIPPRAKVDNLSAEALAVFEQEVFVLDEANGPARVSGVAQAHRLTPQGGLAAIPMLSLCYRVTDATEPDEHGRFWVTNVLCKPGPCEALEPLPPGHPESIEQLVQLRIGVGAKSILAGNAPIIRLSNGGVASNWEGIAQLDDLGFLVIADTYPTKGQIFGFVAYRPSELPRGQREE